MNKKLYKSKNKVVAGVIAGIAEHFNVDPTLLRLAYLVLTVLTGIAPCVIIYIVAIIIVPNHPEVITHTRESASEHNTETKTDL